MAISLHPVDHKNDRNELVNCLKRNLPLWAHERRYEWLYQSNPDGPAWSWFVCDGSGGDIVGVASVFPRSVWIGEKRRICGQVGDFAVSIEHRSLGPAVLLQRATFRPVDDGNLFFCYDCPPHAAGMSTFRRLSMAPNSVVDRYVLLLQTNATAKKRLGVAAAPCAALGNLVLRAYKMSWRRPKVDDLQISEHTGPFDEEFTRLDTTTAKPNVIRGSRCAVHLNWRYRSDPLQDYRIWTVRRKGELLGFMVFCMESEIITIVDLVADERSEAISALLASLGERFGRTHQSIHAYLSRGSQLIPFFQKMHFRRRSVDANIVAYAKPGGEASALLQNAAAWGFQQADIRA